MVQNLEEQIKEMQASITILECKALQNSIRLHGVVEEKEDIRKTISSLFAEYLEEQVEDVTHNLDAVCRVNAKFASQNQLPRDVVVKFLAKKMKEEIVVKSYKEPLELEGQSIKILKEFSKKVIDNMKIFKPLTDKLKKLK